MTLPYPTLDQVEKADRTQLARWHRFLSFPGAGATNKQKMEFDAIIRQEQEILERIEVRFKEMGGMTPEISRTIGWEIK